jgi:hypothetical protein
VSLEHCLDDVLQVNRGQVEGVEVVETDVLPGDLELAVRGSVGPRWSTKVNRRSVTFSGSAKGILRTGFQLDSFHP